jgi:ATP adenylyltransferase
MKLEDLIAVSTNGERITLNCSALRTEQKARILALCREEFAEIIAAPGDIPQPDVQHTATDHVDPDCIFCYDNIKHRIIEEWGSAIAIMDAYPVTEGHVLVIPKRHVPHYFDLTNAERRDADTLMEHLQGKMARQDPSITGYNIGVNCGESAGQTIFHVHYHLFPRRFGDTDNPRGGVRGAIRGRRAY